MIRRLEIDLDALNYRRAFRQILSAGEVQEWLQIRQRGLLFCNWKQKSERCFDDLSARRVHYVGLESDDDIEQIFKSDEFDVRQDTVFVATLRRDNMYQFSTGILDRATVIFVLGFVPNSLEERHQLFNLFHKSLMIRRCGSLLYYYSRVVDMLTSCAALPPEPPDLIQALGPRSLLHQFVVLRDRIWHRFDVWHRRSKRIASMDASRNEKRQDECFRHVVITGWYGSETAGDKAILRELVHVLHKKSPGIRITLTSIVPGLSKLTNLELQLDAEIIDLKKIDFRKLGSVDLVVFGGGPLMDSSQLRFIDTLFEWARSRKAATLIFGCGVGPLKTDRGTERVQRILRNSDQAFFRDKRSAVQAQQLGFTGTQLHACDPAFGYVERWKKGQCTERQVNSSGPIVALLRKQTAEYSGNVESELELLDEEISAFISNCSLETPDQEIVMLPMHTFWLGNDDRDYNRKIISGLPRDVGVKTCNKPQLLDALLESIAHARLGVPMRYHGHIFMLALNVPFVSINYTGKGGKIANLIERYELGDYSLSAVGGFEPGALQERWANMRAHSTEIRSQIRRQLQEDLRRLENVYEQVFRELGMKVTG